ncbi:MAG: response regulator [Melioribacteraceae bacterium]|nr:response regulator [Melioribacteraceae bacterium]MCF8355652.1 response regulator [Melioribacteraceae bacterium]MCF8395146.1 response regulator [Melioribacteraceae bacterium]MCF8420560.1 response regulator [Melioribacteraceae bacterium]
MKKILIVEDDHAIYIFLRRVINRFEYCEVSHAENGLEALHRLEAQSFDGIISDISMPIMNGLEFIENLSANDNLKNIPIMMISANNTRHDIEKALEYGAFDYLLKPLLMQETNCRIERFLDRIEEVADGIKNKNENHLQKNVMIISSDLTKWENYLKNFSDDFLFTYFDSGAKGLEQYLKSYPAIVVLDKELRTIKEEFIAKKIKSVINEKKESNVDIDTVIIGLSESENGLYDHTISSHENLSELLMSLN